jgi:hypothetical protein
MLCCDGAKITPEVAWEHGAREQEYASKDVLEAFRV